MIALAVRALSTQAQDEAARLDIGAFLLARLQEIAATVDQAATAWEKRDYWVKADQFRMQWSWVDRIGSALEQALFARDWGKLALTAADLAGRIGAVEPPKRIPQILPWAGSWSQWEKTGRRIPE
jgi:hypothetical protein